MVAAGIDPKTVQRRLGHASLHVTLGLYAQATTEADACAAETLDDVMFGNGALDKRGMKRDSAN